MKKVILSASVICLLLFAAQISTAQLRRAMTPADILRIAGVRDAQISPNGEWIVYTLFTDEDNKARTTLWIARRRSPAAVAPLLNSAPDFGRKVAPLLPTGWSASSPRWSPDSRRIAFRATHGEQSGIWVVSPEGGLPRFVAPVRETDFFITYAGESLAWGPDSRHIAFISASQYRSETGERVEKGDDPRVIDRIQYKSRTGFSDDLRTHVWVVDADRPEPRQLTTGRYYDHAVAWSPRGDEIAFLSNHEPDPDANNNSDIFAVRLDGQWRQITTTRGCEYEPVWSPDGKWIAYTATTRDITTIDSIAEDAHLWVIEANGGAGRELTAALDRRVRHPRWSADSREIFFLADDRGQTRIYRVAVAGGAAIDIFRSFSDSGLRSETEPPAFAKGRFQISDFSLSATTPARLMALTMGGALHPDEVWLAGGPTADGQWAIVGRVSAHNDSLIRALALSDPESFFFKSFDGTRVQAWLMKPVGFREDRRYPLILSVHGGPHGMYGDNFNPSFQVYAARGYAVLFMNPRGSRGYGQKFSDGTLREWGGGDYRDLMAGLDEAISTHPWIDRDHLGVVGGSYGGFMTNWIITQTPRFRAAVAVASVSNLISFYSTSLYQDLIHAEFGGFPWDDYDQLWRWSPLRYVNQAQTPALFIHGEQDNDVHITQAEEMYMALRRRGIETVLVRYPREGHGLREPLHRLDALERTLRWFDKYLK